MPADQIANMDGIMPLILTVRGLRVMLDLDLARIYGVTTIRLNEQFRRNLRRFPAAFAFRLTREEWINMRSQNAISSLHGGRRYLPWVFTEYGALQLANVLKSKTAIEASVGIVQVFVSMREQLATPNELAHKLAELEERVSGHDAQIQNLFEAIRHLIEPPLREKRKHIGFMRETAPRYQLKPQRRR